MENQSSDVSFWDDLEKWLELPAHDEPLGELATNGGLWVDREVQECMQPKTETENECMVIHMVGEIGCSATAGGIR